LDLQGLCETCAAKLQPHRPIFAAIDRNRNRATLKPAAGPRAAPAIDHLFAAAQGLLGIGRAADHDW